MKRFLSALFIIMLLPVAAYAVSPSACRLPSDWTQGNVYSQGTKFYADSTVAFSSIRKAVPSTGFNNMTFFIRWHSGGIDAYRDVGLKWLYMNLGGSNYADAAFFEVQAGGTHFNTVTNDGVARTRIETGVSFQFDHWYKLEIRNLGTSWEFYVDDVLVSTHTTTLPGPDAVLHGGITAGEGVAQIRKEYWQVDFDLTQVN